MNAISPTHVGHAPSCSPHESVRTTPEKTPNRPLLTCWSQRWRRYAQTLVLVSVFPIAAEATIYTIDDPSSPISATFSTDASTYGRISVTLKAQGGNPARTWTQGTAGSANSGDVVSGGTITTSTATKVVLSNATIGSTSPVTVTVELVAPYSNGDLRVTLGNSTTTVSSSVRYPYPFHTSTGAGHSIVPANTGYVVPTSDTSMVSKSSAIMPRRMEFCGGVAEDMQANWIGIIETADDANLVMTQSTVSGSQFVGTGPTWLPSNNNATQTSGRLSYNRTIRYRFSHTGGYVTVAKQFRAYADTKGWLKTLAEKVADFPGTTETTNPVLRAIGAPVIYLWGDGRSTSLLDALKNNGVNKAMIQFSVNHSNGSGTFDTTLFSYAQGKGYNSGVYDIYTTARTAGGGSPYDGFVHLWPDSATAQSWAWITSPNGSPEAGQGGNGWNICMTKQEEFARTTRLSSRVSIFGLDSEFFDVHCAQSPRECYHASHFETRSTDIAKRQAMLNDAYAGLMTPSSKKLLTGTEQVRSWAVPYLIWGEGVQHLGEINSQGTVGTSDLGGWGGANGQSSNWPGIMVDMKDLSTNSSKMNALMLDGYQVPLWDLVYHDCVLSTLHWERAQNKFLYVWDKADLAAIVRGQTALLNLVYQGTGTSPTADAPAYVTDNLNAKWSTRWLDTVNDSNNSVRNRVLQTITNVCGFHQQVGLLEMINHEWLTTDRTVQKSEFSDDGGANGVGVVVNFGTYDWSVNRYGPTPDSTTWSGSPHAGVASINVAPNSFVTYTWTSGGGQVAAPTFTPPAGTYSAAQNVTIETTTAGATIRYTTNGVDPTPTTGTVYSAPVNIATSLTLKAIAYKSGMTDSTVTSGTYTINTSGQLIVYGQGGANEGWILESNETSTSGGSIGGTSSTANNALRFGDDTGDKQYRSIVSFDTSGLPDGAVIDSATIRLTRGNQGGSLAFPNATFGSLNVAIKSGFFGTGAGLAASDFASVAPDNAPPDAANVAVLTVPASSGSQTSAAIASSALQYINKTGTTQFRIDFGTTDNDNNAVNYAGFFSGHNATNANRPQLVINYH